MDTARISAPPIRSLANSIAATLAQVAAAGGAVASPSISNLSLTPGDSYVFSSTYTSSDWTGELIRLGRTQSEYRPDIHGQ